MAASDRDPSDARRVGALAIAKRVIGSNREEGLAVFLEELVKRHEVEPVGENG